jgi:hypothetical protein
VKSFPVECFVVENFQIYDLLIVCFWAISRIKAVHSHDKPAIAHIIVDPLTRQSHGYRAGGVPNRRNICRVQGVKCFSVVGKLQAKC